MTNTALLPVNDIGHISIAVPNLEEAQAFYVNTFGCSTSIPIEVPEQGIRMVYIYFNNIKIELMEPTSTASPINKFIDKHPAGGLHHICLTTDDAQEGREHLSKAGIQILGNGDTSVGHHGRDIFFIHPKDALGTLIEIEQSEN